jgi:flavin reductase (DIM6/NTAB) family NADH-FMN oxidoreductase RutF
MFSASGPHKDGPLKDTARNAIDTGQFVYNIVPHALRDAMNRTSAPVAREVDEFEFAGLAKAPSRLVKAPRVALSPISLECRTVQVLSLPTTRLDLENRVVFGEVIGVHIADEVLVDGRVDLSLIEPIARCGYQDYAHAVNFFSMPRP